MLKSKLKQVTDNIHGTIYLSILESELISKPYFYRLHDIYQSSTVYMTFPSNRTKRYEHSLGTMELASSILFAGISNADNGPRADFFSQLRMAFQEILTLLFKQAGQQNATYFSKNSDIITEIFCGVESKLGNKKSEYVKNILHEYLRKGIKEDALSDSALDYVQYYPTDVAEEKNADDLLNLFLYRCILEALRVVALFHDAGHPPYSHIIEKTLEKLYLMSKNTKQVEDWDEGELEEFCTIMQNYENVKKCDALYTSTVKVKTEQLHEKIGLSFLQSAINDTVPALFQSIQSSDKSKEWKVTSLLYYIIVIEFVMAIRVEKDAFFRSIHSIVDGVIDADRLDYIMRDSINSGVNWGQIPYKRIINSAKIVCVEKDGTKLFPIAFLQKLSDDIADLLLMRYKIFTRLNYHHSCVRTTVTLQASVFELAVNYFKNVGKGKCANPEINILWKALALSMGDRNYRIIQWNDSWLISVLHHALVEISNKEELERDNKELYANLKEILLNQKRFYTLIKRNSDSIRFIEKTFEYAQITEERLNILEKREYKKYYENHSVIPTMEEIINDPTSGATDSLRRIRRIRNILKTGDLEILEHLMPMDNACDNQNVDDNGAHSVEKIFRGILEDMKCRKRIKDYEIITNEGREKLGLPTHRDALDEIYLYNENRQFPLDDKIVLRKQIEALEKAVPWVYVYFAPIEGNGTVGEIAEELFDALAKEVAKYLKKRYEELFGKMD